MAKKCSYGVFIDKSSTGNVLDALCMSKYFSFIINKENLKRPRKLQKNYGGAMGGMTEVPSMNEMKLRPATDAALRQVK